MSTTVKKRPSRAKKIVAPPPVEVQVVEPEPIIEETVATPISEPIVPEQDSIPMELANTFRTDIIGLVDTLVGDILSAAESALNWLVVLKAESDLVALGASEAKVDLQILIAAVYAGVNWLLVFLLSFGVVEELTLEDVEEHLGLVQISSTVPSLPQF
jgi:hypothetical protein